MRRRQAADAQETKTSVLGLSKYGKVGSDLFCPGTAAARRLWAAGGVILPVVRETQAPADFVATLAQVTELNSWKVVIEKDITA